MTVNLERKPTWDASDEVMLNAMLRKKDLALGIITEAPDQITNLDRALNRLLRPNVLPELTYTKTPRLAYLLQAEFKLEPRFFSNCIEVRGSVGERHFAVRKHYSPEGVARDLSVAIADCTHRILVYKETLNGCTDHLGV